MLNIEILKPFFDEIPNDIKDTENIDINITSDYISVDIFYNVNSENDLYLIKRFFLEIMYETGITFKVTEIDKSLIYYYYDSTKKLLVHMRFYN